MTKEREALKMAFKALKSVCANYCPDTPEDAEKAITAAEKALAQPEQEPVAIPRYGLNPDNGMMYESNRGPWCLYKDTTPPQRKPWVGLTNVEITSACKKNGGAEWWWRDIEEFARDIEAKLKEKNT